MNSYCAFIGHQPQLSIAELEAVIPDMIIETVLYNEVVIFNSHYELDQSTIDRLGGTLILGRKLSQNTLTLKDIPACLVAESEECKKGKITFSLRTFGLSKKIILNLYRDCKDTLKKNGRSSRYLGTEKKAALAVALHDHELISRKKGVELIVIFAKQEEDTFLWIGTTIGGHNVNNYTKRDIGKPVRDTEIGLLPPKLAQTLLNFGSFAVASKPGVHTKAAVATKKLPHKKLTIYDPFCGTGVIPIEALTLGFDVLASDISKKAVDDTTTNTTWWLKELEQKKPSELTIFKHDATKAFPTNIIPDVIVTETTLGPNLHKRPNMLEAKRYVTEAEVLEDAFLRQVAQTFPLAPIVCMFPVWYTTKDPVRLTKIWKTIASLGYDAILPTETAALDTRSIIYRRPQQFVGREIVILVPTKK